MTSTPRRGRPLSRGDRGVSTAEYIGTLAVTALVISALLLAISPPQVMSGARDLVCAVIGQGCDLGPGQVGADGDLVDTGTNTGDGSPVGARGDEPWCEGIGGCVLGGLGQVGSALWNVGRAAWDDVTGIWGLITDPGRLIDAAVYIWNNPLDAMRQMVWDDETAEMWGNGDIGGAIGRTIWNVGSWFIPGVNLGKGAGLFGDLGRLGRLGTRVSGALDEIADLANRAQRAAQNGNLDEAADLAADAQRRADDLADQARRSGCLTAGLRSGDPVLVAVGGGFPSTSVVRAAGRCDVDAAAVEAARRQALEARAAAESGLVGRVGYADTALGEAVLDARVAARDRTGNYAAAQLDNGEIIVGRSRAGVHAEEDLVAQARAQGRDITSLYTEREPCARKCQALTEGINVQYTWQWEPSSVRPPRAEIDATIRSRVNERLEQQP